MVLRHHTHKRRVRHKLPSIILPLIIFALVIGVVGGSSVTHVGEVSVGTLILALGVSFSRLIIAYVLSIVIGIPLALLAERSHRLEAVLLPIYDVLESMPILAFFPVLILFFIQAQFLEAAAIAIIFLNMLWNIVFNVIGGLKVIPKDITAVAVVFGYRGFARFRTFLFPAIIPSLVTGSILAFAEGWNMLIVAEVLHTYAPASSGARDLFGIGSALVTAAASGEQSVFLASTAVILIAVVVVNLLVWQPLLARSERYKFE